jgi:hypothetical protein
MASIDANFFLKFFLHQTLHIPLSLEWGYCFGIEAGCFFLLLNLLDGNIIYPDYLMSSRLDNNEITHSENSADPQVTNLPSSTSEGE